MASRTMYIINRLCTYSSQQLSLFSMGKHTTFLQGAENVTCFYVGSSKGCLKYRQMSDTSNYERNLISLFQFYAQSTFSIKAHKFHHYPENTNLILSIKKGDKIGNCHP